MKIRKSTAIKHVSISATILVVFFFGIVFIRLTSANTSDAFYTSGTVTIVDGVQIINLNARLGFNPSRIQAQSNIPTKLIVETKNTFDCTAYLNIPQINFSKFLPPTGLTEIDLHSMQSGEELEGYCGSNTYKFVIRFS